MGEEIVKVRVPSWEPIRGAQPSTTMTDLMDAMEFPSQDDVARKALELLGQDSGYLHLLAHRNDAPDARSKFRKRLDRWRWKASDYASNLWDALRGIRHDEEDW